MSDAQPAEDLAAQLSCDAKVKGAVRAEVWAKAKKAKARRERGPLRA